MSRRALLLRFALVLAAGAAGAASARADGGEGGGGSSGKGGGDNSGHGGGDDGGGDKSGKGDDGDGDKGRGRGRGRTRDYKRAQKAVKSGKSRPLPEILGSVASQYPGKVVDVRVSRYTSALMYDVKVITPAGKLIRVRVAAETGAIVNVKGF
ncbi:MAG: hypothetical protein R3D57_16500 [Hyphomicrobiaceae bacterium]